MSVNNGIALIEVDPQIDFGTKNGSLYVPSGEEVVDELNKLRLALEELGYLNSVVLTQDSHPSDHVSFQVNNPGSVLFEEHVLPSGTNQMMWPVHCQIGTPGHDFLPGLVRKPNDFVVPKQRVRTSKSILIVALVLRTTSKRSLNLTNTCEISWN